MTSEMKSSSAAALRQRHLTAFFGSSSTATVDNNNTNNSISQKNKKRCLPTNTTVDHTKTLLKKRDYEDFRKQRSLANRGGCGGKSRFGRCPLCSKQFPLHVLESHASNCDGAEDDEKKEPTIDDNNKRVRRLDNTDVVDESPAYSEPLQQLPGLYHYEDFISEEEEARIMEELDGTSLPYRHEYVPWKSHSFNGPSFGKRWGVHCNLRERTVTATENPSPDHHHRPSMPHFFRDIVLPRIEEKVHPDIVLKGCPANEINEANAIDYRKKLRHHLRSHVDDRQLSKEPILNLSLAGDCYMKFRNVAPRRNTADKEKKVLLKRRCLQVLTGLSRYDFSHGIENSDLLSERRVSITMRTSPLTPKKSK